MHRVRLFSRFSACRTGKFPLLPGEYPHRSPKVLDIIHRNMVLEIAIVNEIPVLSSKRDISPIIALGPVL